MYLFATLEQQLQQAVVCPRELLALDGVLLLQAATLRHAALHTLQRNTCQERLVPHMFEQARTLIHEHITCHSGKSMCCKLPQHIAASERVIVFALTACSAILACVFVKTD